MSTGSHRASLSPAASAGPAETVHSHSLSDEPVAAGAQPGQKICCVCGKDVAHAERFKDKRGHYWCYDCGLADSHKRHPDTLLKCPECEQSFPSAELAEHEGRHLCHACIDKLAKAAKREAARKAAAEEAERQAERSHRHIIWGSIAFALIAIAVAAWAIFR